MDITSFPYRRLGLRWSLLSVAAVVAMAAASDYEKNSPPPARPPNLAGAATEWSGGETVLHGALSGVLSEDRSAGGNFHVMDGALRPLASIDQEWHDLVARRAKDRSKGFSLWSFIRGTAADEKLVNDEEKEPSSIFGEKADEAFFMDVKALLARERREERAGAVAVDESQAAGAWLRASLLMGLVNHNAANPAMLAEAALVPINVPTQSEGSGSGGDSVVVATGYTAGYGDFVAGHAPSFPPGSLAGDAGVPLGGGGNSNSPATGSLFPPMTAPAGGFGAYSAQSGVSQVVPASHGNAGPAPANVPANSTIAPSTTTTPVASNAVPSVVKTTVFSQASGSTTDQGGSTSPAAAPTAPTNIYVTNYGANTVNAYNQATGNPLAGFTPISLSGASAVAAANNILYVGTFDGSQTISTYNLTTGAAINTSLVSGINQLEGMVVSGNTIYVASAGSGLLAYNATTGAAVPGFSAPSIGSARGIAVSGNRVYVVDTTDDSLRVCDATTGEAISNFSLDATIGEASAVAVSGNTMYIDDTYFGTIGEYNATTGVAINAHLFSYSGTVIQLSIYQNDLYVAGYSTNSLGVYNLTTDLAETNYVSPTGLNHPWGAVAVPEPGCVVLMMVGVAALAGRRRRAMRGETHS